MAAEILVGNCVSSMAALREKRFHMAVTSPPYWNLRSYQTDPVDWPEVTYLPMAAMPAVTVPAWRGELGAEPDPLAYIGHLVEVFRGVRRVLRDDSVLWVNIADSYNSGASGGLSGSTLSEGQANQAVSNRCGKKVLKGIASGNLTGIPWRLAFALQADGWVLRMENIWHCPNKMPESVSNRCTRAHEQLFMFSKGQKYFYDADAVSEPSSYQVPSDRKPSGIYSEGSGRNDGGLHRSGGFVAGQSRNLRSVWLIASEPLNEDHYASFPTELPKRCILAGTSQHGVCALCGAPYARVVERGKCDKAARIANGEAWGPHNGKGAKMCGAGGFDRFSGKRTHGGWKKTCKCEGDAVAPAEVLDPFGGSGRTAVAAWQTQRDVVLCEIREEYAEIARRQIAAAMQGQRIVRKEKSRAVPMLGAVLSEATLGGKK